MKIGIVGAGFAGLSAAVFALERGWRVEVLDAIGVGGGASGVASGLLHPYPGKLARRSRNADEAMGASQYLLDLASQEMGAPVYRKGIVRKALDAEQAKVFEERALEYPDLKWDGHLHIKSGLTVFSKKYLEGLWRFCRRKGAILRIEKLDKVPRGYDAVILAAGHGMLKLTDLKLNCTKGQILACDLEKPVDVSVIGDGYLGIAEDGYHLGSTYEHDFEDDKPNLEQAKALILPRARRYVEGRIDVTGVKAGIRVCKPGDYYPMSCKVRPGVYALTGFGSRGLLYHALLAKEFIDHAYCSL